MESRSAKLKLINEKLGLNFSIDAKPWKDRNCWDKIWDNMDKHFRPVYITHLGKLLPEYEEDDYNEPWFFLTAKPAICWQALIKTIEEP